MKWDELSKEKLLIIADNYEEDIVMEGEVTDKSESIQVITKRFGDKDVNGKAILYQLANMKFFKTKKTACVMAYFIAKTHTFLVRIFL